MMHTSDCLALLEDNAVCDGICILTNQVLKTGVGVMRFESGMKCGIITSWRNAGESGHWFCSKS